MACYFIFRVHNKHTIFVRSPNINIIIHAQVCRTYKRNEIRVKTRNSYKYLYPEAATQRCSVKKVFLEISQNSQESTCARVSKACNCIKKETLEQVFSCEFLRNFLRTPFLTEHLWWLLLSIYWKLLKSTSSRRIFTKSNTPPSIFFTFLKLFKWYQIAQSITFFGNF